MKKIDKQGTSILLFDSIKEMPIGRYNSLNKILIQDIGFGSTFQDAQTRLQNINYHISKQNWDDSKIEMSNLFFSIFSTLEKAGIKSRLFLCFVSSIGDCKVENVEDEQEVQKCFRLFDDIGLTVGDVEDTFTALKKKLIQS